VRLFFAKLRLARNFSVERDSLTDKIYKIYQSGSFNKLLSSIGFKVFSDSISSQEIEDAVAGLQAVGIIGKSNPTYEHILLYYMTEQVAENIVSQYSNEVAINMDSFVAEFLKL